MQSLKLERDILLNLDHPFILNLLTAFRDNHRIYLITEFIRGLDLFDTLRKLDIPSDKDTQFYISSLILALEYLHERNIVHRDLKPENVMIDEEGYPKLIDFGTATIIKGRTYTHVGTP